jgi:hypothetical protein
MLSHWVPLSEGPAGEPARGRSRPPAGRVDLDGAPALKTCQPKTKENRTPIVQILEPGQTKAGPEAGQRTLLGVFYGAGAPNLALDPQNQPGHSLRQALASVGRFIGAVFPHLDAMKL